VHNVFDIKTNKPIYQDPPPTVTGCKAVRRLNDLLRRTRMYMDQAQKLLCPTNLYFEECGIRCNADTDSSARRTAIR
jgi:hypothetical protein